jgi:hypothetical protein
MAKIIVEANSLAELISFVQQLAGEADLSEPDTPAANGEPPKPPRRRRQPAPPPPAQAGQEPAPQMQPQQFQPQPPPATNPQPIQQPAPQPQQFQPQPQAFTPGQPPNAFGGPAAPAARPLVTSALEAIDRLAQVHGVESVYNWAITRALGMPPTVTVEQFRTQVIHTLTDDQLASLIKAASASG